MPSGDLLHEWPVGQSLGQLDLSPDGSFLIALDTSVSQIYRIDAATGEVTSFGYSRASDEGLLWDVAILSDGTALFSQDYFGSGFNEARLLDLTTGELSRPGIPLRENATFVRSADGSEVLIIESGISNGPINIYATGTGIIAERELFSSVANGGAYNGDFAATYIYERGILIYDHDLNLVTTLADWQNGQIVDLDFSADGSKLYVLNYRTSTIDIISTVDWSLIGSIGLHERVGVPAPFRANDGALIVAPDESFFTIVTNSGLYRVDYIDPATNVVTGSAGSDDLAGSEGMDDFAALAGVDYLAGGLGDDSIDGGSDVDTAIFSGNRADYIVTQTSTGVFQVAGPDGTDTLTNIEYLQFDDGTERLLRGTGVSVTFETADPSVYQSAMDAIRDFDGNALGGNGSWLRIGSADINGDGDVDQILVNDAIGRFATVGTQGGLVYFDDYSWAGETRVAGIYIDPLVQSGDVIAGSANDSQRRFQNDLEIENINRVLGADDYDGDGIWEVYFALTDGTAYLRALMHEDGNIRYANYQSEQEVIDYLTANGYDESTFGDWFGTATGTADTLTFVNEAPKLAEIETFERPVEFHSRPVDEWQVEYFG